MSSIVRNELKQTLTDASREIRSRMERKEALMRKCVESKLSDSLDVYGDELDDTCRYILIRNPVVITKEMSALMIRAESEKGANHGSNKNRRN